MASGPDQALYPQNVDFPMKLSAEVFGQAKVFFSESLREAFDQVPSVKVSSAVTDYCAEFLVHFIGGGPIRFKEARPNIPDPSQLSLVLNNLTGRDRGLVAQTFGDVALFYTGLFSPALREMSTASGRSLFETSSRCGEQAYRIAAIELPLTKPNLEAEFSTATLFEPPKERIILVNPALSFLGNNFSLVRYGLTLARESWEKNEALQAKLRAWDITVAEQDAEDRVQKYVWREADEEDD